MVYLIGVDHLIQYKNNIVPDDLFTEFKRYLEHKVYKLHVVLLAEEFSEEALRGVYNSTEAIVRSVAETAGIEHLFCDPEESDRKKLGIPYFAEIRDYIKQKYNISERIILDHSKRKEIENETIEVSKKYWKIREEFWFDRIADKIHSNIIFVCGHEHVPGFGMLLKSKGYESNILKDFWREEIFGDYCNLRLP